MNFDIQNEKEQGIYDEIWVDKVYGEQPEPGQIVLDIGANIGYFTLYALQASAKVYAFEPEPHNYDRLVAQVKANDFIFASGSAFKAAVAGDEGGRTLYLNPVNIGGHRIVGDIGAGEIKVASITLDEICKDLERVDMIKMDCEGAEHEIFENASPETMAKIQKIVMEFHPVKPLEGFLDLLRPYFDIQLKQNKWDSSLPYIWATKKQ